MSVYHKQCSPSPCNISNKALENIFQNNSDYEMHVCLYGDAHMDTKASNLLKRYFAIVMFFLSQCVWHTNPSK